MSTPNEDFKAEFKAFFQPIFARAFSNIQDDIEKSKENDGIVLSFKMPQYRKLTLAEKMCYEDNATEAINEIMQELTKEQNLTVMGVVVNKGAKEVVVAIKKGDFAFEFEEPVAEEATSETIH